MKDLALGVACVLCIMFGLAYGNTNLIGVGVLAGVTCIGRNVR